MAKNHCFQQIIELFYNLHNFKLLIFSDIKKGQSELKDEINLINKKIDGVVEQTADLVEFRCNILNKLME